MSLSIRSVCRAASLVAAAAAHPAMAHPLPSFVPTGAPMEAPRGFSEMCARDHQLCTPSAGVAEEAGAKNGVGSTGAIGRDDAPYRADGFGARAIGLGAQADWRLLKAVNRFVNRVVHQQTDLQTFHRDEVWQPSGVGPGAVGDCEDIALEKRRELIAAGFPADRLALAVVYRHEIGLHTILVARTDAGDVLLDSRNSFIEAWNKPPYSWVSVQSMTDAMVWRRAAVARG